jgi:hypothetical protein
MAKKRRIRPRMLAWYRADRSSRLRRVLVMASMLVMTGATVGAAGLRWGHGLAYVALALVVAGGVTAIAGLWRELREERWLALRTDALVYAHAGTTKRVRWKHVAEAKIEGPMLVLVLRSGKRIEIKDRFAGTTRASLRDRIEQECRRDALGIR